MSMSKALTAMVIACIHNNTAINTGKLSFTVRHMLFLFFIVHHVSNYFFIHDLRVFMVDSRYDYAYNEFDRLEYDNPLGSRLYEPWVLQEPQMRTLEEMCLNGE